MTLVVNGDGIRAIIIAISTRGTLMMLWFDGCVELDAHSTAGGALIARACGDGWHELVTRTPVQITARACS